MLKNAAAVDNIERRPDDERSNVESLYKVAMSGCVNDDVIFVTPTPARPHALEIASRTGTNLVVA